MTTRASICFVCHGNICRSPTAQGVMRRLVDDAGLGAMFEIDSAGVSAEHEGEPADARSRAAASRRGYVLDGRARQFVVADLARFDLVLAADRENLRRLGRLAGPHAPHRARLELLRAYDPRAGASLDVPDPWSSDKLAFEQVLDICERSCAALLAALCEAHGLGPTRG